MSAENIVERLLARSADLEYEALLMEQTYESHPTVDAMRGAVKAMADAVRFIESPPEVRQ